MALSIAARRMPASMHRPRSRWGRRSCAALMAGVAAGVRDGAARRTAAKVEALIMEGHLGRARKDRAAGGSLSTRPDQTLPGLPLTLTAACTVPDCLRRPLLRPEGEAPGLRLPH